MRGIVIAGTHSGCGKTTMTIGLLAALKKRGLRVQSFKAGPDFIDSGLHSLITGRPSRNLDLWMCGKECVKYLFADHSSDADISVVEGVMGLYDGEFSTARLASVLELPIILVVDAYGMAESAGAVVRGFNTPPKGEDIGGLAGVIFNRIASERHYQRARESVYDVPILGYLPRTLDFEIPHRHLGLTVAEENPITKENMDRLADAVMKHVDIEKILRLETGDRGFGTSFKSPVSSPGPQAPAVKIAVAYDKAFCFYYEDNLDLLRKAGAEIVKFSPLSDKKIPEGVDAVYIGGGYPELHAESLSGNKTMLVSIRDWAKSGKPIYAECGGLMFLSQGIYDFENRLFKMSGILPFETTMKKERSKIGYREVMLEQDCILGRRGDSLRGHEFHYSEIKNSAGVRKCGNREKLSTAFSLKNNLGVHLSDEGYRYNNTLASYVHIHFGSNPHTADNFIGYIKETVWKI